MKNHPDYQYYDTSLFSEIFKKCFVTFDQTSKLYSLTQQLFECLHSQVLYEKIEMLGERTQSVLSNTFLEHSWMLETKNIKIRHH